ncbi:MAG: non-heme iron oxygenase ferredoxin subunit [Gemmatimonadota bacterium]
MSAFHTVAQLEEVPEGSMIGVEVGGVKVAVIHEQGRFFALHDCCSHEEFPLSDGDLENGQITCILHGARFDLETGVAKALPAVRPVKTYEVRVEDGEIQVSLG